MNMTFRQKLRGPAAGVLALALGACAAWTDRDAMRSSQTTMDRTTSTAAARDWQNNDYTRMSTRDWRIWQCQQLTSNQRLDCLDLYGVRSRDPAYGPTASYDAPDTTRLGATGHYARPLDR